MSIVVFEDVSLHLGGKKIVESLSLRIADGDRIGLIGPNGSGKTTLLRMLAGEQSPDGGRIRRARGVRVGYLAQDVTVEGGRTLRSFVRDSVPGRSEIEQELAESELGLAAEGDPNDPEFGERMIELAEHVGELHERMAHFDTFFGEHEALRILAGLGFRETDLDRDLGEFSGGWKMRAVLGSLLFQRPDLLLLDEPTNHLDMPSVAWLSGFLARYNRAFILISHDREFLNEQIRRVVSFEMEGVRQYPGNYEAYRTRRDEEKVLLENRAKNLQKEREDIEKFVDRFRAKATKAKQVQSRVKKLEKMEDVQVYADRDTISFRFPPTPQSSRNVLDVEGLNKSYGDRVVLQGVELHVQRGDRIALLGVNGAGKTTLLRVLAGEMESSGGEYKYGANTKLAYYAQHHAETLPRDQDMYSVVKSAARDLNHQQVRAALGAMLFGDVEVEKKISVLSGGERARVALACMLVNPGNVLLMDEPTNHLDLESSERLADAIDSFDGTLLFVSHNRAFIRRLATKLWFVEDGKVVVYPGNLDDYLAKVQRGESDVAKAVTTQAAAARAPGTSSGGSKSTPAPAAKAPAPAAKAPEPSRMDRKEAQKLIRSKERRCQELETRIAKLEAEQAEREAQMSDPVIFQDGAKQASIAKAYEQAKAELSVAMDSWSEVQDELETLKRE